MSYTSLNLSCSLSRLNTNYVSGLLLLLSSFNFDPSLGLRLLLFFFPLESNCSNCNKISMLCDWLDFGHKTFIISFLVYLLETNNNNAHIPWTASTRYKGRGTCTLILFTSKILFNIISITHTNDSIQVSKHERNLKQKFN